VTLADFVCHSQVIVCKNQEQMKMTASVIPLIGVITLVSCANPSPQPSNFGCAGIDSPDHQLRACIVEIGKFPPPLNESRVDIRETLGKVLASRNFWFAQRRPGPQRRAFCVDARFEFLRVQHTELWRPFALALEHVFLQPEKE
jgi:hypothetical protein